MRPASWPRARCLALALAAALAAPSLGHAQGAPPTRSAPVAPPIPETLDLDQAVRLSLELSPEVRRTAADVALLEGRLQEAKGTFDTLFRFRSTFGHVETALTPESLQRE